MELLDRYLHAIKFWLPRAQQDDIIAELSEDLRSQIEEEEGRLGHKLSDDEVASILKQRGRPLLVASRYLPQRYLIGPVLFPAYRLVLTIVMLCWVVPWLLVRVALFAFDPAYRAAHPLFTYPVGAWPLFWEQTVATVGAVTIIFAVIEIVQSRNRSVDNWDPRRLPAVRDPNRIPRLSSIIEIAANLIFVVWWTSGMWSEIIFERAGVRIVLGPVWRTFFWIFLFTAMGNIVLAGVNLGLRYWTAPRAVLRLVLDSAGAIAFCWMLKANLLAEIVAPQLSAEKAAKVTNAINSSLAKSFPIAVIACIFIVGLSDVGRLIRIGRGGTRLVESATILGALLVFAIGVSFLA
jgi:hypothetical protein